MEYHRTTPWPGFDEAPPGVPVVINAARPGRNRPRLASEHPVPRQVVYSQDGQLFVPASTGHYRSSSVSGGRPAQVVINNENLGGLDDYHGRRPRSIYYDWDVDPRYMEHSRSRSRRRHYSRTPSPREEDPETREKLRRLEDLERKEEDERRERRLKEKLIVEKAKKDAEDAQREKEEKELKERAIAEYKAKEEKERAKKKKEKEEADEEFAARMRKTLFAKGYSESQVEKLLSKGEKSEKREYRSGESSKVVALSRPTYIRVRRKHLDPETLDLYQLPWEWDDADDNYIIIKRWIPERDQEILFEHTRKLNEARQLTYTTTELRKERDQLLLIKKKEPRKKSPSKNWLLT